LFGPFVTRLYKYLPEQYVRPLLHEGAVLFRALSYFRDYEDAQVRGDEFEGTKLYRPINGLEVTIVATQEKVVLPHTFESSAQEDDIFVFCLSTLLSKELATQFKTNVCVEIINPALFISKIRAALSRRPSIKNTMLVHGEVNYYEPQEPPIVDWALPERIAMSKLEPFRSQQEYRIAFGVNGAFEIENTSITLVAPGVSRPKRVSAYPERLFKLGSLSKICRVHRFG
jgi:hypothetical protein